MRNKFKVAVVAITLNEPYWQYIDPMVKSMRKFFLNGHDVDYIVWTDMPKERGDALGVKVIPTESFDWPLPTLFRYSLFLRQEELLKEYDYIFYCDADMLAVSRIGDEILGEGLTAAPHPGYYVNRMYIPPYEPNDKSTAFIPRPGRVITENGKKRFLPFYAAGGFQGGRTDEWIKAMKVMKENIDNDFSKNYIAIWNDESHWNKYLFDNPASVYLDPSYVYPDTLNTAYYRKVWGRNFVPKLVTITKKFSMNKDGGTTLNTTLQKL